MALKGEAKKNYQRDYMRKRRGSNIRSNTGSNEDVKTHLDAVGLTIDKEGILQKGKTTTETIVKTKPRRKRRDQMTAEELGVTGHDGDGNPLYE